MKSKKHSCPLRGTSRKSPHPIKAIDLGAHSGRLRLVAFSDYRVQNIELLIEELSKLQPRPDLILYAGDDIERFRPPGGKNLFEAIASQARYGLCAVVGNDDEPSVRTLVSGKAVLNVHLLPARLGSYAILGVDGAPRRSGLEGIGYILHSEPEIAQHLRSRHKVVTPSRIIVVSHAPPEGILDQAVRFSKDRRPRSIGSRALKKFVKSRKEVVLVVCGYVHRCGGMHQRVYGTTVVNAANHDDFGAIGRFAIVDLEQSGKITVEWREIREVSCVVGIGRPTAERLRQMGVRTVHNLAALPAESLARVPSLGRRPEILQARARAHAEKRPILFRPLELPPGPEIFLDLETDPEGGKQYVWLIGLCVGRDGPYRNFFAETPADEEEILVEFLRFIVEHPNANLLAFSGCRFEQRVFEERFAAHGLDKSICSRILDLSPVLWQSVALPIMSEGVKDAATVLGFRFRHPKLSGLTVACLYQNRYPGLRHPAQRRKLRRKFFEYNEDDVRCLPFILRAIENLCNQEEPGESASD